MTEAQDRRRRELKGKLTDAFVDAAKPDTMLSRDEIARLGVPARYQAGVSRDSHRIVDEVDAVNAATEWADYLADRLDADDALTSEQILAKIPRL